MESYQGLRVPSCGRGGEAATLGVGAGVNPPQHQAKGTELLTRRPMLSAPAATTRPETVGAFTLKGNDRTESADKSQVNFQGWAGFSTNRV